MNAILEPSVTQAGPVGGSHAARRRHAGDYKFGTKIGEGLYLTVYLALDIHNTKTYAIKVLSKRHIVKEDKIKYVNIEKITLHRLGQQHPGVVQLYYTFQDDSLLFFVLDFAEYGELLLIIRKFGLLLEAVLKFYMCQIVDAVQFIHLKGVIHRDLKPENILVGYDFNLKITDFGAAKLLDADDPQDDGIDYLGVRELPAATTGGKGSFVGTAEYVLPELLKYNTCGFESDVWAMGCILFQFFHGNPPFKGSTEYLTFEKIINVDYAYTASPPAGAVAVIDEALQAEPSSRPLLLQIKAMSWFKEVRWDDKEYLWGRKVPRFEPYVAKSTAFVPTLKNGSNRNMNKSSLYQQLHNQLHKNDLFVPLIGKTRKAQPQLVQKLLLLLQPQQLQQKQQPQPQQFQQHQPHQQHQQHQPQQPHQPHQPHQPQQLQSRLMPKTLGPPPPQQPYQTSRAPRPQPINTALPQTPPLELLAGFASVGSPSSPGLSPSRRVHQHVNLRNNTSFGTIGAASTAAAMAVASSSGSRQAPVAPVLKPPLALAPSPKPSNPSAPPRASKAAKPKSSPNLDNITLLEVSGLLMESEKILKMDTILKLQLSHHTLKRSPSQTLDDSVIDGLIRKHQSKLRLTLVPVVTVVTNKARVFFIDAMLNVMLIDLKANEGSDYLMYDYEFESDDAELEGYLIIELIQQGGDLIFLKRITGVDGLSLHESVKVVKLNGSEVKLGQKYGWIDCLLMAKEMVLKETAGAKHKPKTKTKKPEPQPKKPIKGEAKSASASPTQRPISKFAYAAAAAVHK